MLKLNKLNNISKLKKVKLVKVGCVLILGASLLVTTGCNAVDVKDYYIVSKDGNYYLCNQVAPFTNYDDYDYNSIVDGTNIGSICSNGNNFDYESHHLSIKFLSEFQVVNLADTINNEKLSEEKLLELANSKELQEIADNYFVNKEYPLKTNFIYDMNSTLKLFVTDDKVVVGYDISPERIFNTMKYVYSITDIDTLAFTKDDIISTIEINSYIDIDTLGEGFITYNDAVDIINEYNSEKTYKLE